ncbi:MAG: chorismate synthase [Microbacteriaceae bacterium]|nr:chorismate synthase [Microbacteriaceae bacterium]
MLRWITAGESHGPELIAVLEGLPAGVPILAEEVSRQLSRRRLGYGRGARMKFEQDRVTLSAGIRDAHTLGSPVAIRIGNTEWPKWEQVMATGPIPEEARTSARGAVLTRPRPGHADLAGMQKYGFTEARPILERASARETAARVALGTVARAFLAELGISVLSYTVAIGGTPESPAHPAPEDLGRIDADPVRAADAASSAAMVAAIDEAKRAGETLGGIVEILAYGLPPGLGSHVQADRRLDGRLAGALMGIQAIKGVEFGDGFHLSTIPGSQAHDEMQGAEDGIHRLTDHAGGVEGGMSNGSVLRVRIAMKPIATVPHALRTVDVRTGEAASANHQRSDICAVPAAGVVAEAMTALVLAQAVLEKFGGDSVPETRRNLEGYLRSIPEFERLAPKDGGAWQ